MAGGRLLFKQAIVPPGSRKSRPQALALGLSASRNLNIAQQRSMFQHTGSREQIDGVRVRPGPICTQGKFYISRSISRLLFRSNSCFASAQPASHSASHPDPHSSAPFLGGIFFCPALKALFPAALGLNGISIFLHKLMSKALHAIYNLSTSDNPIDILRESSFSDVRAFYTQQPQGRIGGPLRSGRCARVCGRLQYRPVHPGAGGLPSPRQ